jgi:hypothetical protein
MEPRQTEMIRLMGRCVRFIHRMFERWLDSGDCVGMFPELPKCLTLRNSRLILILCRHCAGDASPASRKARGGEVWIVEEAWGSERPALPLRPPLIPIP